MPVVLLRPAQRPAKKLLAPVVLEQPAWKPMKVLQQPKVLQRPALQPIKVLWLPVVVQRPAQKPAKKLLVPVPPVPDIQLTMLVVLQTLNALAPPPPTRVPFTYRPVALAHNLTQAPAEMITVLHKPAEPTILPMMVFWQPVTTAQPAWQPTNMLLQAVVELAPAQNPANKLWQPKVLHRPA